MENREGSKIQLRGVSSLGLLRQQIMKRRLTSIGPEHHNCVVLYELDLADVSLLQTHASNISTLGGADTIDRLDDSPVDID